MDPKPSFVSLIIQEARGKRQEARGKKLEEARGRARGKRQEARGRERRK